MSWAWRSFLSNLRPVRRHGSQMANMFGRNNLIRSKGYASGSSGDATTNRHLYVVLDDHKDGFGVHKLDLGDNGHGDLDCGAPRSLTQPPVFRLALATLGERVQFATVGSSIVAIGNTIISPELAGRRIPDIGGVLIYDTKTTVLTVAAHVPSGIHAGYKAAMTVGNSLYMLGTEPPEPAWDREDDDWDCGDGSLHSLTTDPLDPVDSEGDKFWGWQIISDSSPWLWSHFQRPPRLPFLAENVTAYGGRASPPGVAVQHELLVSLRPTDVMGASTFSFSTASREWTRCGDWNMPVIGHIHHDNNLDAWVGLHAINDGNMYGPHVTDGYLCAGNVTSAPSEWKVSKDKIFRHGEDDAAGWRHVDAKLVQIGLGEDGTEYCLMERLRLKEEVEEDKESKGKGWMDKKGCWGEGGKCLLRLSFFRVERGKHGEPMATARRLPRSYEVSWHSRHFDAQAFWI